MARLPHLGPRRVARVEIIRYTTSDSPAPLIGVRDEGQVFGLPGVPSLAALWALPLAEIRQRVRDRRAVPAADARPAGAATASATPAASTREATELARKCINVLSLNQQTSGDSTIVVMTHFGCPGQTK